MKKDDTIKIMNPTHPQWHEFLSLDLNLYREGLTPRKDNKWSCDGSFRITRRRLEKLPNVDVDGTLKHYMELGVGCDCTFFDYIFDVWDMSPFEYVYWFEKHKKEPKQLGSSQG